MEITEYYNLNNDGSFTKTKIVDGITSKASGTYIIKPDLDPIGGYWDRFIKANILIGTANHCDLSQKFYEKK